MVDEYYLLTQTAQGSEQAFTELIRLYQAKVRAYCTVYAEQLNEEVDDLAQDIFLQIYLSASKFKQQSTVNAWIFFIAKHTIKNKLRKKKLLYFWKLEPDGAKENGFIKQINIDKDAESQVLLDQYDDLVHRNIAILKPKHKEVLVLFEYTGLNYEQLAQVLKISIGTVKSRLFNARKELAEKVLNE